MAGGSALVSAIIVNGVIGLVILLIFEYVRPKHNWLYQARRNKYWIAKDGSQTQPPPLAGQLASAERRHSSSSLSSSSPSSSSSSSSWPSEWSIFGWLHPVVTISDDSLLQIVGLDSYLYVRFFKLCLTFFAVIAFFALAIFLPLHITGDQGLTDYNQTTVANLSLKNNRLWAHAVLFWFFSAIVFYFCYALYHEYYQLRTAWLKQEQSRGQRLSLLTFNLPERLRQDDAFHAFWREQISSPSNLASTYLVRPDTQKLVDTINERDEEVRTLEHAAATALLTADEKSKAVERPTEFKIKKCQSVDSIDYHSDELRKKNQEIDQLQQSIQESNKRATSGFATFTSSHALAHSLSNKYSDGIRVKPAPEPRDVYWPNVELTSHSRFVRTAAIAVALFFLIFFWSVPVTFAASLSTLENLGKLLPFLEPILNGNVALKGFVQGFLPSLALIIFQILLPSILYAMSKVQGLYSESALQKGVLKKFFLFQVFNFFLISALAGSIFEQLDEIKKGGVTNVVDLLAQSLPNQADYFSNYIILTTLVGVPLSLLQPGPLIVGSIKKKYLAKTPYEIVEIQKPIMFAYGTEYPMVILIAILGFTYMVMSPLVIVYAILFFGFSYLVKKYQALYMVYNDRYESGGAMLPIALHRLLWGLVVAQLTTIGLLGLKESFSSILLSPLPVLTLVYMYYMQYKFVRPCDYLQANLAVDVDAGRVKYVDSNVGNENNWGQYFQEELKDDHNKQPAITLSSDVKTLEFANECAKSGEFFQADDSWKSMQTGGGAAGRGTPRDEELGMVTTEPEKVPDIVPIHTGSINDNVDHEEETQRNGYQAAPTA